MPRKKARKQERNERGRRKKKREERKTRKELRARNKGERRPLPEMTTLDDFFISKERTFNSVLGPQR